MSKLPVKNSFDIKFRLCILSILVFHLYAQEIDDSANPEIICNRYKSKVESDRSYCYLEAEENRLICFGCFEEQWELLKDDVNELVLCDWHETILDPENILQNFPSLQKFILSGKNLTDIKTNFPPTFWNLETVSLTNTSLKKFSYDVFRNLPVLRTLDLRNNAIEQIDPGVFDISSLEDVYFSGNPLKCTEDLSWILDSVKCQSLSKKIVDKEKLRCTAPFEGRPLVPVIEIIVALKEECRRTVCDCELVYVVARGGMQTQKQLMAFASVNCSHRGLTRMPDFLPENATTLRLTGNEIEDLTPLVVNPVYKSVLDLYLDDNRVESIAQLEGSHWLDHFRLLSLRGNKLSDLPTYALENVLLHSRSAASLYLGNNPWRCDCLFTPGFQDLLIRYPNIIKDINDVRCATINDDDKSNKQIRDLTRTEICVNPDEDPWLHPLDVLNIVLASLIFLVLGKLLYDYWCFKKTGKLPWIVAKIP